MAHRKPRLDAARRHGRRVLNELRHLSADAALHWVLSHRARVAQFRRAVKGTPAARRVDALLGVIREEATELRQPRPRRAKRGPQARRRAVRRTRSPSWLQTLARYPLPIM